MDRRTLRLEEGMDAPTERPGSSTDVQDIPLAHVGEWTVTGVLDQREISTLYRAEKPGSETVVIKKYHAGFQRTPSMKKVELIRSRRLMTVLESGTDQGEAYEVLPQMEGSLDGAKLDSETVLHVVIPQVVHALAVLHQNRILHNDLKPSNLFWTRQNRSLVLGDFDASSLMNSHDRKDSAGTREYMAPEVLMGGAKAVSQASDLCSLGLTLLSLLQGQSPLHGKNEGQMRRMWMRGIPIPEELPPQLKILINGLVRYAPEQRMDLEKVRHWMRTYGVEEENDDVMEQTQPKEEEEIKPLWFGNYPVLDVQEMVQQAGTQWKLGCFLLEQKKMSLFLRQFGLELYRQCVECEKYFDKGEGLFVLLHSLCPQQDFYWCGSHYSGLEDFVSQILDSPDPKRINEGGQFLRANLLQVYLKNVHADKEKLKFADELARTAFRNPELALTQLLTSLSDVPVFKWKGEIFETLDALVAWLLRTQDPLDPLIQELVASKRFEAWLTFINQGRFLGEIQADMKGVY